jgi:hypothetical protein
VYEKAQTPYQRLLQSGVLSEKQKTELAATYSGINPLHLLGKINGNLEQLWRLADRPDRKRMNFGNRNSEAITQPSVTV